jgi:hypothetical protein
LPERRARPATVFVWRNPRANRMAKIISTGRKLFSKTFPVQNGREAEDEFGFHG